MLLALFVGGAAVRATAAPTTSPVTGPTVSVHKIDETTVTGQLVGLDNGQILLASPAAKVALEDVIDLTPGNAPANVATAGSGPNGSRKLTGRVIGTSGSWQGVGNTRDKVFDGDLQTYFDAPAEHADDAWVGLDLGTPKLLTQIKYAPRPRGPNGTNFANRMVGGKFQGSSSPTFRTNVVDLFTVDTAPPDESNFAVRDVSVGVAFRYVRYLAPEKGLGNVAELEFWGKDAPPGTPTTPQGNTPQGKPQPKRADAASTTAPASAPVAAKANAATQPAGDVWHAAFGTDDQLDGRLAAWNDKGLRLANIFGEVEVPVSALREAWRGLPGQISQAKALPLEAGPEDAAFVLKDNNVVVVRGVALGVDGEELTFKFNDEPRKIKLTRLVGVIFGGQDAKRDRSFHQSVQLVGDQQVSGQWTAYDPASNALQLKTAWGQTLRVPFNVVMKIRSANGRLTNLADLKPTTVEQVPYFDRMLPYRIDKSLTGGPLKLADGEVKRGIAVHARTALAYDLGGAYDEFKVKVGFQQPEGKLGECPVRVLGDGKVLWEDPAARGDAPKPADVAVSVGGVKQLILEVDFGPTGDTGDRVVWANPRLLRSVKSEAK